MVMKNIESRIFRHRISQLFIKLGYIMSWIIKSFSRIYLSRDGPFAEELFLKSVKSFRNLLAISSLSYMRCGSMQKIYSFLFFQYYFAGYISIWYDYVHFECEATTSFCRTNIDIFQIDIRTLLNFL